MRDKGESFLAFESAVQQPLIHAIGSSPLCIYGVGKNGIPYATLLAHYFSGFTENETWMGRIDFDSGVIRGLDDLRKAGREKLINGKYQVICIIDENDEDHAYRVGKAIRVFESEEGWRCQGISVTIGSPPAHRNFYDLTRSRVLDGFRRRPLAEEKAVYGADSTTYIDELYLRLQEKIGEQRRISVVERGKSESAAQYLAHRLFEDRVAPITLIAEGAREPAGNNGAGIIIIPGSRDESFLEQHKKLLGGKEIIWLEEI